jgi:hypothetical protein
MCTIGVENINELKTSPMKLNYGYRLHAYLYHLTLWSLLQGHIVSCTLQVCC